MGLDTVELVMEIEEAFGVSIPDEDAAELVTVGQVYEYLLARLEEPDSKPPAHKHTAVCLTAAAFYRLRRAWLASLDTPRAAIRPNAALSDVMPAKQRRRMWTTLVNELGCELPPLRRPDSLVWGPTLLVLLGTLACIAGLTPFFHVVPALMLTLLLVSWPAAALAVVATRPYAIEPGKHFATVGGLARTVLAMNYQAIYQDCRGWNSRDVWDSLKIIIVEQLGVDPDKVTSKARFVEDFGAD